MPLPVFCAAWKQKRQIYSKRWYQVSLSGQFQTLVSAFAVSSVLNASINGRCKVFSFTQDGGRTDFNDILGDISIHTGIIYDPW
jgi:hypothetical protein